VGGERCGDDDLSTTGRAGEQWGEQVVGGRRQGRHRHVRHATSSGQPRPALPGNAHDAATVPCMASPADHGAAAPTAATPDRPGLPWDGVLAVDALRGVSLVAGRTGLQGRVTRVGVLPLDQPDEPGLDDVRPGELLLAPARALRVLDDAGLGRLARCLAERSAAGLVVAPGRSTDAVPPALAAAADAEALPVLVLPSETRLEDALEQLVSALAPRREPAVAQ